MGSTSDVGRRDLIQRAAAIGLISVPTVGALASCASSGGDDDKKKEEVGKKSKKNPLGVKADAALDVVIFTGGYDDQYAKDVEKTYKTRYPKAEIKHTGTVEIRQKLQPRFVSKNPPDIVNNSGEAQIDMNTLLKNKQVAPFNEMLDGPSWDDPSKTVRETLIPGTAEIGMYGDDKVMALNIAYTVYGLFYSKKLLDSLDAEYPETWDDMLAVCKKAKAKGIAGWTYAGRHPRYASFPMLPQIAQVGGYEALKAIDNLEDGAWTNDAVKAVFSAYEELVAKGYILKGSDGIDHLESQAEWAKGKALFIPNGTWVENESKKVIPKDFDLKVGATPSITDSDKMPFGTLYAVAGEPFILPTDAKNKAGGMEFMRIMYSKKGAQNLSKLVSAIPCVQGATEGMDMPPGMASATEAIKAAGKNIVVPRFRDWYVALWRTEMNEMCKKIMKGEINAKQACDFMQKAADKVKKDDALPKYKRTD